VASLAVPGENVKTWSDWMAEKVVVVRRKSRKEVVPEGSDGVRDIAKLALGKLRASFVKILLTMYMA